MAEASGRLAGKVAVVTGGAGALGLAIGRALGTAGARVMLADIKQDAGREAIARLVGEGIAARFVEMDVTSAASIDAAFDEVAADWGSLDILVNNAGVAARKPSIELALEDWNRVIAINLTGTFLCSCAAARRMMAGKGGAIVNIASIMGLVGNLLYANPAYHASKGGIVNLTRAHAAEWAPHGIRVNAVAPTFVETALTAKLLREPGIEEGILARTPMGRLAQAHEVGAAVAFLASDEASFVTGHVMPVDGGWTAV